MVGRGTTPDLSALGHKQTFAVQNVMSALPPIADMCGALADVRYVPIADIRKTDGAKQKDRLTAALPKSHRVFWLGGSDSEEAVAAEKKSQGRGRVSCHASSSPISTAGAAWIILLDEM